MTGFLEFRLSTGVVELPNSGSALPAESGQVRVQRQLRLFAEAGFHEASRASLRPLRRIRYRRYPGRHLQRYRESRFQEYLTRSIVFVCGWEGIVAC